MTEEIYITKASFNLTRACTLKCDYCFAWGCTKGKMPLDVGKRAVDFLLDQARRGEDKHVAISYWGGEPLMEWFLLQKISEYAIKQSYPDIKVSFDGTTNGTLLTPEKFQYIKKHNINFMVSLDGTQETHDRHRKKKDGKGSHETVVHNIKAALKEFPDLMVRMSLHPNHVSTFYNDITYILGLGINQVMWSPVYEGEWTEEKWHEYLEQTCKIIDYAEKSGRNIRIKGIADFCSPSHFRNNWMCGAGKYYVGIDIDGAMYPCHRFNKFTDERPWNEKNVCMGHIDHGITNPEFRQQFIDWDVDCKGCWMLTDTPCHGGCAAVNYDLTGDIKTHTKDMCQYAYANYMIAQYWMKKYPRPVQPQSLPPLPPYHEVVDVVVKLGYKVAELDYRIGMMEKLLCGIQPPSQAQQLAHLQPK